MRTARASFARSRVDVRAPHELARRVIVKAHVVKMTAHSARAAALHLRYIQRDGVQPDGRPGLLYGPQGPVTATTFDLPRSGEKHQFRLIVSPEDAAQLDLTAFVRRLMTQMEQDLGRRLEWAAVNHHDTGHPHAHVVLRGVDRDGHEVRLDRAYISNGLRWRAQEIATRELGPRCVSDIERAYDKEVAQDRYTAIDRELKRRAKDHRVSLHVAAGSLPARGIGEVRLVARLEHLERIRLATRESKTTWNLAAGWSEQLKEMGARGDILAQMHKDLRGDPARYRIVLPGRPLEPTPADGGSVLYGRVLRKGLSDELKGTFYVVLETPAGAGYRLPLDARSAEELRAGDLVTFTTRPERRLLGEDGAREPGKPGVRAPKHRVVLRKDPLGLDDQVVHRGPVWLDRARAQSLAPYGFGFDVRKALDRRNAELRTLGIDPADPQLSTKLREMRRRALGHGIEAPWTRPSTANGRRRVRPFERER